MFVHIKSLYHYRELILSLASREIKARYKQSIFGRLWIILNPLSLMIIYTLVFSSFGGFSSDNLPYPIFVYCGLVAWSFFNGAISNSIHSLVQNVNLIKRIYFPREVFPITAICSATVDFLAAGLVFLGLMFIYQVSPTFNVIFVVPIFLIQAFLILGLSLFLSALNVFYRDTGMIMQLLLTLWMFLSPVIYPVSMVPEALRNLYMLNPMAGIIENYRRVLLHGVPPDYYQLGYVALISGIILILSYAYFKKNEMLFADEI